MKLSIVVNSYLAYKKTLGEKSMFNEWNLKSFCKFIGTDTDMEEITGTTINDFLLSGKQGITASWFKRHTTLKGFFSYALNRGYVSGFPLPLECPHYVRDFIPYIYSNTELERIFTTALVYPKNKSHINPVMIRMVLVLTYTLGLRIRETLSIKLKDIDWHTSVISINDSKFYKSRFVTFNQCLKKELTVYLDWRKTQGHLQNSDSQLFLCDKNNPVHAATVRQAFNRIKEQAGIKRCDNSYFQPRLHDLRHTFATNRLVSWYREGKNVQQLLPVLSVYMGHSQLANTSVYLTMTDLLLDEANKYFENYVINSPHERKK
ncbi:MAG: tyrosine-type recombinase/integrase [Bacteroidales bacterium]|jgi:site-specific recombinase XerD|nr:tyrosine-type recombinase/integrase [Bacteroidales bacterium]